MKTSLYRHFDAGGRLLYIGISANPFARLSKHQSTSGWFRDVAKIEIEWLSDRASALSAEAKAIQDERPLHNSQRPTPKEPLPTVEETFCVMQEQLIALFGEGYVNQVFVSWFDEVFGKGCLTDARVFAETCQQRAGLYGTPERAALALSSSALVAA